MFQQIWMPQTDPEPVRLEIWEPNAGDEIKAAGDLELFVVEGNLEVEGDELRRHAWLRLPVGSKLQAMVMNKNCFSQCGGHAAPVDAMLMEPRFYRPYSEVAADC